MVNLAEIIPQIAGSINWINTMGYFWDTADQETGVQRLREPREHVAGEGLRRLRLRRRTQFTPLSECETLASWPPSSGTKCGMMLFQ